MKLRPRTALIGLVLLGGCAQKNGPPPYAPERSSTPSPESPAVAAPAATPSPDLEGTATPEQTLADLDRPTITRLDFGLYRLRAEYLPGMEQRLRSQGLAAAAGNAAKSGFAAVGLVDAEVKPGRLIEISVATADSRTAASAQTVARLQALQRRVIAEVRGSFGGACPGQSFDPETPGSCEAAVRFYEWFERPAVDGNSQSVIARARAAYNLYSLAQVTVRGNLVSTGERGPVSVSCKAPLIRDAVTCTTSGLP